MMGASRSELITAPLLPRVKMVDLFFREGLEEKKPAKIVRQGLSKITSRHYTCHE